MSRPPNLILVVGLISDFLGFFLFFVGNSKHGSGKIMNLFCILDNHIHICFVHNVYSGSVTLAMVSATSTTSGPGANASALSATSMGSA